MGAFRDIVRIGAHPHDRAKKYAGRDVGSAGANIKQAPGKIMSLHVENNQAAAAWIQIFDLLAANVVLGATEPDFQFKVAANASLDVERSGDAALPFETAMSIFSTTAEKGAAGSAVGQVIYGTYI